MCPICPYSAPISVSRGVLLFGMILLFSCGCEKVPTFKELTKQETTAPATAVPPAAHTNPPDQQSSGVTPVAPNPEDPQKIISDFKNKPTQHRNNQDLAQISNLTASSSEFSELDLTGSGVTDDGLQHLAKLLNLESLNLTATKITNTGLSVTTSLPKLTKLTLNGCLISLPMIETLSKLERLEFLSLESTKVGDTELPPLANLSQLKELDLSYCPITDNAFKVLGSIKNLEVLRVGHTGINGSGMQFMKRKKSEAGLKVLNANVTRFGEQGLQFVKGIETLEELDIANAGVTDRAISLNLKGLPHLKRLNLSYNLEITDKGTQVLGAIKSLEELSLANCQHVGDQTLFYLKGNKELVNLNVNGCGGVTPKGIQSLKKFLPNCEFR